LKRLPNLSIRKPIWQVLLVIIPLLTYALILLNRSPNLLRPISLLVRHGFLLPLVGLLPVFWGAYALRGYLGTLTSLTVTLAAFALSLAGLWASGDTNSLIVSGLLPWSDAAGYYGCANLLLEGERFTSFCSSRPLFSGFLALVLQLCGRNLTLTVAVMVLIAALCCYAAARAIAHAHGALPAALMLIILLFFYRRYAGTTMSESMGLPLGALGLAMLWRSDGRELVRMLIGLALMTLGLLARLGPFFILPFLMLWIGWARRGTKRFGWIDFGMSLAVVAACMAVNWLAFQAFGSLQGALFSKLAPALYGVTVGDENWNKIYEDHPEINRLSEAEQTKIIYQLIFENIRNHPSLFLKGILAQYGYLFSNTWYSAYGYLHDPRAWYNPLIQYPLFVLNGVALVFAWKRREQPLMMLTLSITLGLLLSVPFVPPRNTSQLRAYAAAIPILGMLPGLGLSFLLEKLSFAQLRKQPAELFIGRFDLALTVILLLGMIIAPFTLPVFVKPLEYPKITCPTGMETISVFLGRGSSVTIMPGSSFFLDWLPYFHQERFRRLLHGMSQMDFVEEMENIETPATLFRALDLRSKQSAFVISPASLLPPEGGLLTLCGHWRESAAGRRYGLFDVVQVLR